MSSTNSRTGVQGDAIDRDAPPVLVRNQAGAAPVLLVCEHASNFIPEAFCGLGLDAAARESHVAWDPGAAAVARGLSGRLDAPLVECQVSRLVYDCNRPPEAEDAMPARSEVFDIPGNARLTPEDRQRRVAQYYLPFRDRVSARLDQVPAPQALVTVHSFTPVFLGKPRDVELGILHDTDHRLADAMLEDAARHTTMLTRRNEPYGPQHGVTHTLKEHAIGRGMLNVMLEIRNDLIRTPDQQDRVAGELAGLLRSALGRCGVRLSAEVTK